jgi:hypothetical protein
MGFLKNPAGFWISAWKTGWIFIQPAWIKSVAVAAAVRW